MNDVSDSGKLSLGIDWDGHVVHGVRLKSSRPKAYRILEGKSPDHAVRLAPLLFSVCGKAQHAAASAAVSAAQGDESPKSSIEERGAACEAMQESLWRLLLDWPDLLGLPQEKRQFLQWHGMLNALATGHGNAEILQAELLQALLGMTSTEWKQLDSYAKLREWRNAGQGLFAPVFAALDHEEERLAFVGEPAPVALQPNWSATGVWRTFADCLDPEFAAMPLYGGKPLETGALAHNQHAPLLQDVLRKRPSRLLARVIARLIDLLDSAAALAQEKATGRIQSVSASNASGLSWVRTARGMLLHHVRIEAGQVAQYLTVAPTEWNFHPQGALASNLVGLKESDAARLMNSVKQYVLSLDPCVEYEIEITPHA